MRSVHKRYFKRFVPAMAGYVALIFLYGSLVPRTSSTTWRAVLAVLPLLPIVLVIRAMVLVIREQDELERRTDLEALAIASMLTGFGFFSYGLLLEAKVWAAPGGGTVAIWVMPCLFASFGFAKGLLQWWWRRS